MASRYPTKEKFLQKVRLNQHGCWIWTGYVANPQGPNGRWGNYGFIRTKDANLAVHRVSWELFRGPIPKGLTYLIPSIESHKGAKKMHYRNGREANNGDKIVQLEGGKVSAFGVLYGATPGDDYCNGNIAVIQYPGQSACLVDCLHVDDVAELLSEKGLDKRPAGK